MNKMLMILAAGVCLAVCGCTVTKISATQKDGWKMERYSLFQKPEIQKVSVKADGSAELDGYKNGEDISPVLSAAVEAAVAGAVKGATKP